MTIKKMILYSGGLLAVATVTLISSLVGLNTSEQKALEAQRNMAVSLSLADELKESSRSLTSAVRQFVVTGDERYANEYMHIIMMRSGQEIRPTDRDVAPGQLISLGDLMIQANYSEAELNLLRHAAELSDNLVLLETEAINAARGLFPDHEGNYTIHGAPDKDRAIQLVFGAEYEVEVSAIMEPFVFFKHELSSRLNQIADAALFEHDNALNLVWLVLYVVIGMFSGFLVLISLVIVRPVLKCDEFAKQVAAGNLDTPLSYSSDNEIGSLASSLRSMLHSLLERICLQESMRYYSAVIQSVDAGVIIKDKDGRITDWNAGAEAILGYSSEEIIGNTTKCYAPKETHAEIDDIQKSLMAGVHTSHVDVVRRHKDGRMIDCSASYTPIFDENGKISGSVSIFHDITEKKLAEHRAKSLAAIVSAADAGIIALDARCNILEWNIGAENILGYKADEIVGKNTKCCVRPEDYAEIDEINQRLIRGEHTTHAEVVRKHKDGRLVDCSATFTPIFNEDKVFTGSIVVFQDISDKKQIERELKEAVLAAKEASKAKSTFLANMSHEIRTPMNGIIGFAELALDDENLSPTIKDYLLRIKTSADTLLIIINDILDVSKIEAGAVELEKIPFDLRDIFSQCENIGKLKAAEKGIELHFYAEPILGKKLLGDPTKLSQALLNLLSNAIKFTNYGMVKLTAILEQQTDEYVELRFEVKDSGIGMTEEQVRKVFAPFVQADSKTTRKYGGTGLGLSITKSFVEMMGGTLRVDSTPGLGSKFSFCLTFETMDNVDTSNQHNEPPLSVLTKPRFSGDILVCEDSDINQQVIIRHLSRIGLTPTIASNGQQGLQLAEKRMHTDKPFDLILMDIHMPIMDGIEATEKIIALGIKTPIVALTANAMSTDKEKYLKLGMADYISKPFTTASLWSCLARYLPQIDEKTESLEDNTGCEPDHDFVIDQASGILQSAGDELLYKRIKKNFYEDYRDVMRELNQAIAQQDISLAHRTAHTLKSTASLIGAFRLASAARAVEMSLASQNPYCPPEQLGALDSALADVLKIIEPENNETPGD